MSEHITKRHNKTLLLYHIVYPLKYRRDILTDICLQISERYEIHFIEIGNASDHVHFLVQSVPKMNVSEIIRTIKSITSKQFFRISRKYIINIQHIKDIYAYSNLRLRVNTHIRSTDELIVSREKVRAFKEWLEDN